MRSLRYVICDVFADRPLRGNALFVFTRATDLDPREMLAVARELRLSEAAFVQPPRQGGHARIRIFTPERELPFAVDSLLGAAVVLGGPLQAETLRLETESGVFPVQVERDGARIVFAWMHQPRPECLEFEQTSRLETALGLERPPLSLAMYNSGVRHVLLGLDSGAAVRGLAPNPLELERVDAESFSVFAGAGTRFEMRTFAPRLGVAEAAAAGAAVGLLAWQRASRGELERDAILEVEQGAALKRPTTLYAKRVEGDAASEKIAVGGAAVVVGRGELNF